jgi:hypothetical protein
VNARYLLTLARAERAGAEAKARVLEEAAAEERALRRDWIDQSASPLGRRRHCAAVKRRIAAGEDGAALAGRRQLLSQEALDAELAALSKRPAAAKPAAIAAAAGPDQLRARLGLVGGARR